MKEKFNLDNLDYTTLSINEIEEKISDSILTHNRPNVNMQFSGLFRVRRINDVEDKDLKLTNSIWYPDWNMIPENYQSMGRCNDKGQNFFYASNYLEASIAELNPNENDIFLIGIFNQKNSESKITTQFAGIETISKSGEIKSLINYKFKSEFDRIIEKEFSRKFQEKVEKDNTDKYKVTIAITNILLKNQDFGCLIYPSVASNLKYLNFGIKPDFIDNFFYCRDIFRYKVIKENNQFFLTPFMYGKIEHVVDNCKMSKVNWLETPQDIVKNLIPIKIKAGL